MPYSVVPATLSPVQNGNPCFNYLPPVQNGDPFVNYLSVTPLHDAAGRLTHYVGIQSDITELVNHKKAELAAKHAALQVHQRGQGDF